MRNAAIIACLLSWDGVVALSVEPEPADPQRVTVAGQTVIDPHPGRMVLRRDAYTLVYDPSWRVPAWAVYQTNQQTRLAEAGSWLPDRAIADPQVAVAPSAVEALEQLPASGYRMVRLVPSQWLGGRHPRRLEDVSTAAQADLTTNLMPIVRASAESPDGLWAGVQQWLVELVDVHGLQLTVIAGCIVDRDTSQRLGPRNDIYLPSHYFVVVSRPDPGGDAVQTLALLLPQQRVPQGGIGNYISSVEAVERMSGLRLLAGEDDDPAAAERRRQPWRGPAPPSVPIVPDFPPRRAARPYELFEPPDDPLAPPAFRWEPGETAPAPPLLFEEAAPAPDMAKPDMAMPDMLDGAAPSEEPPMDSVPDDGAAAAAKDRKVRVFYGTDRARSGSPLPNEHYSGETIGALKLGTCDVSIPPSHVQGSGKLERPWPLLPEDPERHVVLLAVQELAADRFTAELRSAMLRFSGDEPAGQRPAFIFIHGYNNSFADAARRTAQMAFDLDLDIVPIMYSWPSQGNLWDYQRDRRQFETSVPHLVEFLQLVRDQCQTEKLHIICHSMGSDLFQRTLDGLNAAEPRGRIDQIILAAPDIDSLVFRRDIAPKIEPVGSRVTIYVSARDRALMASQYANRDRVPRLGIRAWDDLQRFAKIDQVDVTGVDTSINGHLYYGDHSGILVDIRGVLDGADPQRRHLIRVGGHYIFPAPDQIYIDWDLRRGWEWTAFQQGWEVLLDRKVLLLTGLLLIVILFYRWRIRSLKRALHHADKR